MSRNQKADQELANWMIIMKNAKEVYPNHTINKYGKGKPCPIDKQFLSPKNPENKFRHYSMYDIDYSVPVIPPMLPRIIPKAQCQILTRGEHQAIFKPRESQTGDDESNSVFPTHPQEISTREEGSSRSGKQKRQPYQAPGSS